MTEKKHIAIVGATGLVGLEFIKVLEETHFPCASLTLYASAQSEGKQLPFRGQLLAVQDVAQCSFTGIDVVFFSAGRDVSLKYAPKAAAAGAWVIDNSTAFRTNPEIPLMVPQVNGHLLKNRKPGIIANPNCTTIPVVRVLQVIQALHPVKKVVVSTYQAASGAGIEAINEMKRDAAAYLQGQNNEKSVEFAVPLAFNIIPFIDDPLDTGFNKEEQKICDESRKILNLPQLKVSTTTVRVPVLNGHSASVYFECETPIQIKGILEELKRQPFMQVYENAAYPTPRFNKQPNNVHVSRVRQDVCDEKAGWFWVMADNLRVGAALNAVQIANLLMDGEFKNTKNG